MIMSSSPLWGCRRLFSMRLCLDLRPKSRSILSCRIGEHHVFACLSMIAQLRHTSTRHMAHTYIFWNDTGRVCGRLPRIHLAGLPSTNYPYNEARVMNSCSNRLVLVYYALFQAKGGIHE